MDIEFSPTGTATLQAYVADSSLPMFTHTFGRLVEPKDLDLGVGTTAAYAVYSAPSTVDFDEVWLDSDR